MSSHHTLRAARTPRAPGTKVFCFFFTKKKNLFFFAKKNQKTFAPPLSGELR